MNDARKAAIMVIWIVGIYSLISLTGTLAIFLYLASKQRAIPVEQIPLLMALSASGGGAVTGLLGLLGRTSAEDRHVTVDNKPTDPIPVKSEDARND